VVRLLIITREVETLAGLSEGLARHGMSGAVTTYDEAVETAAGQSPDIAIVEIGNEPAVRELIRHLKESRPLPIIALTPREALDSLEDYTDIDDFLASPYHTTELALRINRLLRRSHRESREQIVCDGLIIDLARCEVAMAGRVIELTFKEYELLKLLAEGKGRVYTREALLNQVWGYDYYGGDRTVDVHIRRLRSKIEDAKHSYIETVRNIGYRFRKGASL
jgi:DNA-binding response OmpR family regulator